MKITSIDLYSGGYFQKSFSFRDPALLDQLLVKGVTGLDAEAIVPKMTGRSLSTKKLYYNMAMEPRNIVLQLVMNPDFSANDSYGGIRDEMYKLIARARSAEVQLRFNNDEGAIAAVMGRITKFEASHSTDQPAVQLTIVCKDPRLQSVDPVVLTVSGLSHTAPTIIDTLSTAPHGCKFSFTPTFDMDYFQVQGQSYDDPTDWYFRIQPGIFAGNIGFIPGDDVTVTSEHGRYSVLLVRASKVYSIADKITVGSLWPSIFPGYNYWLVNPGGGSFNWTSFSYHNTYWGV